MRSLLRFSIAMLSLTLAACGGAPPPPVAAAATEAPAPAPSAAPTETPAAATAAPDALPTACATKGEICSPPFKWVKKLCAGFYPDVALTMFSKDTPWTRGFLTRDTQAWNASGGESSGDKLIFEEEVLVLAHREADTGGMVVSGASGGYDVLRWDGTCASLAGEELGLKPRPSKPKSAKIPWKNLDPKTREALTADEKIAKVDAERRKECKGVTMGDVSVKCVKADTLLSVVVVDYVRGGGALPPPGKLPAAK